MTRFVIEPQKTSIGNERKLKICLIIPYKFPMVGGYEKLVYLLAQSLSKKAEVHVVCSELDTEKYIPKNIIIHPLGRLIEVKYFGYIFNLMVNPIKFYRISRKEKFDVINAHPSFPSGFTALPAKLLGIPIICTSHKGDISVNFARRNKFISFLTKLTLKLSDLTTVVSKSMIQEAIDAGSGSSKIRVVYNGIDLRIPKIADTTIYRRYKIGRDDFIILFLGRLHPQKYPGDLIKAFPKIVEKVPNAKLIFAGKGEEESKLKRMAKDLNLSNNVIFAGLVLGDKKWGLLNNCDVFVLPSAIEGHPITVIEAMACSKPVIATNLGPFPEMIRAGETGLLVPLHAPAELADAIIELALDADRRNEMGIKARRYAEEHFDINKIADEYLEIYEEFINR